MKTQWFLIDNDGDYELALARYQEVKDAVKNSDEHKEKLLLVHLISEFEKIGANLPEVDPIELIKIRMNDFGYKSADLAKEYGDKGTVSKVLNYKQALSLTMIRKFSRLLRIPVEALTHEYELR
ncbi:helix-turn-helix domain-containing protein [Dyadobacter psychrophilus]|uniref:HTH-type transcriptional regulator / antitoxin HigA n=1 Tax=Dyadobacter psychrophilus TaxID=651661 RepID=A0A1T5G9H7_9BACT|nr:XRE family transcriptional regulator [Dyadobacter psychrophilus]SKC05056.1 HTH-type transcriptional regulator / antitoxin HigA [Dyadobacter psychrophilus]